MNVAVGVAVAFPVEFFEQVVAFELADDAIVVKGHAKLAAHLVPALDMLLVETAGLTELATSLVG